MLVCLRIYESRRVNSIDVLGWLKIKSHGEVGHPTTIIEMKWLIQEDLLRLHLCLLRCFEFD